MIDKLQKITEGTPVSIGLVALIVGGIIWNVAGQIRIEAKQDSIIKFVGNIETAAERRDIHLMDLERRVIKLEVEKKPNP